VAWDGWLVRHRFFSSASLGTYGEAFLGYFAITFVFYWCIVGVTLRRFSALGSSNTSQPATYRSHHQLLQASI